MILSLGCITIVAGALLAWVYNTTSGPIEQAKQEKQVQAIRDVTPDFDNQPMEAKAEIKVLEDIDHVNVFPAMKDGKLVGAAVESWDNEGFSGHISIMFGFDIEGNVTGYTVLSHEETPGLGAKMGEWFSDTANPSRCVIGRNPATEDMHVSKDGGAVDAITAATITSRAFLNALRRAHAAFIQYRDLNQ
ncbi:MAG: RnfABCDGE type electron transport complex subunit G [Muribaculaceae bacterium]|nr:RnfABCDGE type electron transport complex subunit G [Muribaculaceae bacterium]